MKENFLIVRAKINVKFHKMTSHMEFSDSFCVFTILVTFDIYFLGLP